MEDFLTLHFFGCIVRPIEVGIVQFFVLPAVMTKEAEMANTKKCKERQKKDEAR